MAKKRKNKFNHNSAKNAQKQCKKEKKLDNLNQIIKDFPATNTNVNSKANNVREKVDILKTISQKIALLSSKPKVWLKTQAKILDDAFKFQLIPQIKTIAKVIDGKISFFNTIKRNFKLIESTSTSERIPETNKIENSSIQHFPQPSPPLPKLMTLNVTPTAQLEGIINNLLQKYYEESAPKRIKPSTNNKYFTTSTPDISAIFGTQIPNSSNNSNNKKGSRGAAMDLNNEEKNNLNPQENSYLFVFDIKPSKKKAKEEIIFLKINKHNAYTESNRLKHSLPHPLENTNTNWVKPGFKVLYETHGDCNYDDYDDDSNSSESSQEISYSADSLFRLAKIMNF